VGFFGDLLQQYQIGKNNSTSASQIERIEQLERDVQVSAQSIEQMAERLDEIDQVVLRSEPNQD
jgi:hypothetical protein